MLDQKDLELLQKTMESVVDSRTTDSEKRMEAVIDSRTILENQINAIQKNLDELAQYYRITKLERDNTALLLKMIDELSKRIEVLEKKTA